MPYPHTIRCLRAIESFTAKGYTTRSDTELFVMGPSPTKLCSELPISSFWLVVAEIAGGIKQNLIIIVTWPFEVGFIIIFNSLCRIRLQIGSSNSKAILSHKAVRSS